MDALHSCFPSTISTRKNLIPNTRKSKPPKSTSSPSLLLARARKDHDCHDDIAPSTGAKRCAMILKTLDDFINNYLEPPPLRPSVDPRLVLSDNYAPVTEELPPTECELIQGPLPPCLDGVYIRNGPNPQYLPQGQPYHHFEGDGMLHSAKISQGRATLCSRYVKTYKYTTERKTGYPFFPSIFSSFNGLLASTMRAGLFASQIITGQLNPANGFGVDLPYAVSLTSNGDIQTLGRCDFNEKLSVSMTAHPKIDPETGETFAFRFSAVRPFLTYFHFDADGTKHPDVPIFSMRRPSIIHDFAITKKYAVFVDIQITLDPIKVITTGGSPVVFYPSKVPRIGVLPRYAVDESEIRWFDVRINLKTGIVMRLPISIRNVELGNKFVYGSVAEESMLPDYDSIPKCAELVKLDLDVSSNRDGRTVASRMYGPNCYGGEPFFVAREPENPNAEEDDGYLVSFVHDEKTGESRFLVMDAKSPQLDIVAVLKLPRRVPYGFHGLFVKEKDL
ncbi:unnamed protein product [Malus baccata var. baccata]